MHFVKINMKIDEFPWTCLCFGHFNLRRIACFHIFLLHLMNFSINANKNGSKWFQRCPLRSVNCYFLLDRMSNINYPLELSHKNIYHASFVGIKNIKCTRCYESSAIPQWKQIATATSECWCYFFAMCVIFLVCVCSLFCWIGRMEI